MLTTDLRLGFNSGVLSLFNVNFTDNSAAFGGAIVSNGGATTNVYGCVFQSNSATETDGGAIDNLSDGTLVVENSGSGLTNFWGNSAYRYGGATKIWGMQPLRTARASPIPTPLLFTAERSTTMVEPYTSATAPSMGILQPLLEGPFPTKVARLRSKSRFS